MRLAKAGYYGGNPQSIMLAPCRMVLDIWQYELFESDFEAASVKMQQEEARDK